MKASTKIKEILFGTPTVRDVWLVGLWCILVWFTVEEFDLFERLYDFSRANENNELDAVFSVVLLLPPALLWLSFRQNLALMREVERRRQAEENLRRIAHRDPLTGLANRNLLEDRMERGVARSRRKHSLMAVLFIDLDGFKTINDKHGHQAGDAVLCAVAERIRQIIRTFDTAARFGGDEFVVLLEEPGSVDDVARVAQRLIELISLPHPVGKASVSVGACIGIAVFSGKRPENAGQLLRNADQAMYEAKARGKKQVRFFREQD